MLLFTNVHSTERHLGTKSKIIDEYCENALSTSVNNGNFVLEGGQIFLSSRDSLFVRALCRSWNKSLVEDALVDGVFQSTFVDKLRLQQYQWDTDVCSRE